MIEIKHQTKTLFFGEAVEHSHGVGAWRQNEDERREEGGVFVAECEVERGRLDVALTCNKM